MENWMNDPRAAHLLSDPAALQGLLRAPEAQMLMQMLQQSAGDSLQTAAQTAAQGDPNALIGMLRTLTQSQDGAQLLQKLQDTVQKQGMS